MKIIDVSASKLLSTYPISVRWVDMDAYEHVNNARYFDYMTETRASFFSEILLDKNIQYVLVHVCCDFKKPLTYPSNIIAKQYLCNISRTTFTVQYAFHDSVDESIVYAIGEGVLVSIDANTLKPVAVPEQVRNLLG